MHSLNYRIDYDYLLENKVFFGLVSTTIEQAQNAYLQGELIALELNSQKTWKKFALKSQLKQWLPISFQQSGGNYQTSESTEDSNDVSQFDYQGQGLFFSLQLQYQW